MTKGKGHILAVDDDPYVLDSVSMILEEQGYSVTKCSNAIDAINTFKQHPFDAVLSDIKMPSVSGLELLKNIHAIYPDAPVVLMTAYGEIETAITAIQEGAFDFIIKPYNPQHLINSINKAVRYMRLIQTEKNYKQVLETTVQKRTQELANAMLMIKNMSYEMIQRLTVIAEYRDAGTGVHISRLGFYARKIAGALKLGEDFCDMIAFAAPLHDIGKIGIPDNILLKPGTLDEDEFDIMRKHAVIGKKMLADSSHPNIQLTASVALTHHERWDGSGYPDKLRGENIPIEGRIVMLCDQYDALRMKRPYRRSLRHEDVLKIMTNGDGRTMPEHFDPAVLTIFKDIHTQFDEIYENHQEIY